MTDNIDLVRAFCEAFSRRETDELLQFFAEDAIYHNMPMPPVRGKDAIHGVLDMFLKPAESAEFVILHIAEADGVVLTERLDTFLIGGKHVELPVAGVFEVADGKINSWRDYFDMATWSRQTGAS
jgi:limonene-1,2-epoxide hydrolase